MISAFRLVTCDNHDQAVHKGSQVRSYRQWNSYIITECLSEAAYLLKVHFVVAEGCNALDL